MPITQDRMLSLLTEYERFIRAHESFRSNVARIADLLGGEARALLTMEIAAIADFPLYCVREERKHFNTHAKRNTKVRDRQRNARRALGIPEMDSATYRVAQASAEYNREAEREYAQFMRGQRITDESISPFRGEPLRTLSESRAASRAEDAGAGQDSADAVAVHANDAPPPEATRDAHPTPNDDEVVIRDKQGYGVTRSELEEMNTRGVIAPEDIL
jgi:hypothetical protein